MQWEIEDGLFKPIAMRFKNSVWRKIQASIHPIRDRCDEIGATVYLRGSALEAREPHPKSDIDFVLVAERQYWMELQCLLKNTVQIERRPVDVYLMEREHVSSDVLMRLLLHTRSERVAGLKLELSPVAADFTTAKVHWDTFAVHKLPDQLISNYEANACMVKQLLRSIGPIDLVNYGRFTRDLSTCLDWIEERAPQNIIPYFQMAWYHMGTLQDPPVVILPARDWLLKEWNIILQRNGV
jgi:hypothetical protein